MAIDNWKRAIEIAVEMECPMFVSEFGRGGSPDRSLNDRSGLHRPETCEAQFFRAMDILVPILEREGLVLSLEAHPEVAHVRIADGRGKPLGRSFRVKLWPTVVLLRDGQTIAQLVRPTRGELLERFEQFVAGNRANRYPV